MVENQSGSSAADIAEIAELREIVAKLSKRLDATSENLQRASSRLRSAEKELTELRKRVDADITEETVIAISAAVSAYLGNRGTIKAIRYDRHRTWAMQGRQAQQLRLR